MPITEMGSENQSGGEADDLVEICVPCSRHFKQRVVHRDVRSGIVLLEGQCILVSHSFFGVARLGEEPEGHLIALACRQVEAAIYDDEPFNWEQAKRHPEFDAIGAAAAKEMQLKDMKVGVYPSQEELEDIKRKGTKVLRTRMVYKRKYETVSPMGLLEIGS